MRGAADRRLRVRLWALENAAFLAVTAAILLAGSGHLTWPAPSAYLGYLVGYLALLGPCSIGYTLTCLRSGRECRRVPRPGHPLASLSAVWLPLIPYLIAALDERFGWPPVIGWPVQAFGVVLLVSGSGLVLA